MTRSLKGHQALCEALAQEMERDGRVFVFGEDVARCGGVFHVTEGLLDRFGPKRVFDTPISESAIVGLASGASMLGMRPVAEIQFTDLLALCMDHIVNTAAKVRYQNNGLLHAPLVIRTVNLGKYGVYASQSLEAWCVHVPGLKVVMPSNPADAKGLLIASIRDPDPVIFIENLSLYEMSGPVAEQPEAIPLGQARLCREGTDATVVALANMVAAAEEAAEKLADDQVSVEVIDPRTLVPFDKQAVVQSVRKTGRLVIVHEAVRRGGFGAEIAAGVIDSEAFGALKAPIVRVANPGAPVPYSAALHKHVLPNSDDVIAAVHRVLEYS